MTHALRAVKRDLAAKADHNAQVKAFVGGLNALGYKVKLERVSSKPNQAGRARPQLKVVGPEPSRDDQES